MADEPASAGRRELGPTPYDYLNLGLASCTAMTVRMYAERKGRPLDEVDVLVAHDRVHVDDCAECEHADGHVGLFTRTVRLTGALDDAQRDALQRIADRCPAHKTLDGQLGVRTIRED